MGLTKSHATVVLLGMLLTKYHDLLITILPKPLDVMALHLYYPDQETRTNHMTTDEVQLPLVTYGAGVELKAGETLEKAFDPRGWPTLIKRRSARRSFSFSLPTTFRDRKMSARFGGPRARSSKTT